MKLELLGAWSVLDLEMVWVLGMEIHTNNETDLAIGFSQSIDSFSAAVIMIVRLAIHVVIDV